MVGVSNASTTESSKGWAFHFSDDLRDFPVPLLQVLILQLHGGASELSGDPLLKDLSD